MAKSKLTALHMVYPPITNSIASRLSENREVEAILRQSDFYMICGRAKSRFQNQRVVKQGVFIIDLVIGDKPAIPVTFVVAELPGIRASRGRDFHFEFDKEGIGFRAWDGVPHAPSSVILEWFTPDSLLWHVGRGRSGIYGLSNISKVNTFDLLYVGIATKSDSFDRLLKRGHKARQDILSNEPQRYPGARVSDETFLCFFQAESLLITTFDGGGNIRFEDLNPSIDEDSVVADAEKAFISLLKPEYNIQLYANYPKGDDGLYGGGLERYGYYITEKMTLNTAHGSICGAPDEPGARDKPDFIFVEGDEVAIHRPGAAS
jgi:hypothetical protein